jgi:predicted nucleic acid-binding protein
LLVGLEADAMVYVQQKIRSGSIELAWSFVLDYEVGNNPHVERRKAITDWKSLSVAVVGASDDVAQLGKIIETRGIRTMDALHIACAVKARCRYFLTTDRKVLKKRVTDICILNPLDFVEEMEVENG